MPRPFADVPDVHTLHTISDSVALPVGTVELLVNVATAGNLALTMWGDAASVVYTLPVGLHTIKGRFKYANATGTTAVLSPATKLIAHAYGAKNAV